MRPKSILMFERLFLGSLVLGALNVLLSWQDAAAQMADDPGAQQLGLGSGFLLAITVGSFAVYLLLWLLIARQASTVAKWILTVLVALGVAFALPALAGSWNVTLVLSLVVHALEILALVYLFRPDAKAWLDGAEPADSAAAD